MGRMADDFMFSLLILKSCHAANSSLPFLHAHALELSAKSAIFHIEGSLATEALGHDIRKLYKKISLTVSGFEALCPREESYTNYRTVWIHDDPGQNVELPHPDTLNEWELCYFIENITDLKYGFTKKMEQVSILALQSNEVNSKFLALFAASRKIYANAALNSYALTKGRELFGATPMTDGRVRQYFGISGNVLPNAQSSTDCTICASVRQC